jgi:hypothetical protein
MGLRAGASDLLFLRPGSPALFLEIKTRRGVQSETQRAFETQAVRAGAEYMVARGLNTALDILWRRGYLARKLV